MLLALSLQEKSWTPHKAQFATCGSSRQGVVCPGQGVVLPAAGASTHVIAAALMQWLQTLEEPLLTYK